MTETRTPKRIAIFVDGANMFHTQRHDLGWFFDPGKLLHYLRGDDELTSAIWYMGLNRSTNLQDTLFMRYLVSAGYTLRTKYVKAIYDSVTGMMTQRVTLEIEIALDMFNMIDSYDKIILLSGNGDFERALDLLRARGKQIKVLSTQSRISAGLRQAIGSHFKDLQDLRESIERTESWVEPGAAIVPIAKGIWA
jgi:uncharacterized LabA/DUF88 family protein